MGIAKALPKGSGGGRFNRSEVFLDRGDEMLFGLPKQVPKLGGDVVEMGVAPLINNLLCDVALRAHAAVAEPVTTSLSFSIMISVSDEQDPDRHHRLCGLVG
jgi:hypothetical protein